MLRFDIRLKFQLVILAVLVMMAFSFTIISKYVLNRMVYSGIKDQLREYYRYFHESYRPDMGLDQYIRINERGLGGFATLFNGDYAIISSDSLELSPLASLPESYIKIAQSLISSESKSFIVYIEKNGLKPIIDEYLPPPPPRNLHGEMNKDPNHNVVIMLMGKLPGGLYVLLEKPSKQILQGVDVAFRGLMISLAIVLILGFILTIPVSWGLSRPIYRIRDMAESIANLDFDTNLELKNKDEIGDLGRTMNIISGKLKTAMDELKEQSRTDPLTGLANRLKLNEIVKEELYIAGQRGGTFSLILLDIDHFKGINDTYGHPVGDSVLTGIAEIIRENSRRIDVAGRWGGEEFLIIVPDTHLEGALAMADKMRQKIGEHIFPGAGNITASFGVKEYKSESSMEGLIEKVDKALYAAKENGRNCVVS